MKNKNTFKNRILSFLCLKSYLKEFDVMSNYRQGEGVSKSIPSFLWEQYISEKI
ncbi:hypothetical protein M099_3998 [Phocaeicola vulgatus str. 3975 RP4]|uniref:Uncharacterized protein n=1 Tax=Phocaeicola vulgatus str. 3975 RP4 TaxID=1339352 RepID=A0A069S6V7_PHOVU|nr:hypothetical protein M099_3998 [Phocaeicola vulgatus str. 3975 RP4]